MGARVAALALGIALVGAALPPDERGSAEQPKASQTQQAIGDPATDAPPPVQPTNEPPDYTAPCQEGEDSRNSDLCAQWKAADAAKESATWTRRSFWLGLVGAIVGALTLFAAIAAAIYAGLAAKHAGAAVAEAENATRAARDTAVATERIGEAQVRAYLSIVDSGMNVRADGSGIETRLKIKNFGNSPAKKVHIAYRIAIAINYQTLRDSGPLLIPPWEHVFDESIASGTTKEFNHFHGNLPLTPDEMNAIKTPPGLPPSFYATMMIRFIDVFDREITETQHRTAMLQAVGTTMPFFQTAFHPLSWRIDQEQAQAAEQQQ